MSLHEAKEALLCATHDDPYCDVLIDRMAPFALEDSLSESGLQSAPLPDPIFKPTPNQSPLLVRISRDKQWALLDQLLELAWHEATTPDIQTRSVCAFIRSSLPIDKLANRLTRQLDAHVTDLGDVYFRYFDPRVVSQLRPLLTAHQYASWQSGIVAWHYFNSSGELAVLPSSVPDTTEQGSAASFHSRPRLTLVQWGEIEKIEAVNLTLQRLQHRGIAIDARLQEKAKSAVDTAAKVGLLEPADRASHALYELLLAEEFIRHPEYPSALALVTAHGVALMDVVEQKLNLHLPAPSLS